MLHSKKYRAAAMVLLLVMVLGLAACGGNESGGQGEQLQSGDSAANDNWYGEWVSEPTTPVEPVQTQPVQTQPVETAPPVSTDASEWYGVWGLGFDWLLEINSSYAFVYDLDSVKYGVLDEKLCFEGLYDCNYTIDGNVMTLNAYDMEGNLYHTMELTMESGHLTINGEDEFLSKLTDNVSMGEDLTGTWYSPAGLTMRLGPTTNPLSGDKLTFYQDGTFLIEWVDGGDSYDGTYYLTSKFDNPAFGLRIRSYDTGAMEYEFITNDLLMIYTDVERTEGFLLYRVS